MIECLRDEWLYSEKPTRDILFRVIRQLVDERAPMMVAQLSREAAHLTRERSADAGRRLDVVVPAHALPTMIRLGYADCAACHYSPQGGGPLNAYGRGIDQAQSLRGGEYKASEQPWAQTLSFGGRVTQDLRSVLQRQDSWSSGTRADVFRPRLMYRNVTSVNDRFRLSGVVTMESSHSPRPSLPYDPPSTSSPLFVNTALVHYKATDTLEFAGGVDQLPTGINLADPLLFVRARNDLATYDAPAQVKMFWNARRFHAMPFAYRDTGYVENASQEVGTGGLFEVDVLGHQKTVVGTTLLAGASDAGGRKMIGAYTRLGFGQWGIFAEHDVTHRTRDVSATSSFSQAAKLGQVFWAMREWLVLSATGERLRVEQPFEERLNAGKVAVSARLASQITLSVTGRLQKNLRSGQYSRSLALQAAVKTVQ